MIPPDFDYTAPATLPEAAEALSTDGAVLLAGGQSIIPLLRLRLLRPSLLVDIGRIPGLGTVESENGSFAIGAMVTTATIEASADAAAELPHLHDAVTVIADPLVRNMGTVAGNLAHADPLNDLPAVLVASRGHVVASAQGDERRIEADELFAAPFTTTLRSDEIIRSVVISATRSAAYVKFKRAAVDYGVAGVAVDLDLGETDDVQSAGIAVTGGASVALRATKAEEILVATGTDPSAIEGAAAACAAQADPVGDERGSERYKRALIEVLARRSIELALKRGTAE